MPLLWSPVWLTSPDFRVFRAKCGLVVVGWQDGNFVSVSNPLIMVEIPFGGYRLVVKFRDDFWDGNHAAWKLSGVFEDVYALAPGSGVPISAGSVSVRFRPAFPELKSGIVLDLSAITPTYYFMATPTLSGDYWGKDERPFITPPPYIYHPP